MNEPTFGITQPSYSNFSPYKKKRPQQLPYYGDNTASYEQPTKQQQSTDCDDHDTVPTLAKSDSKSLFTQLTSSTSLMTWATSYDTMTTVRSPGRFLPPPDILPPKETWPILQGGRESLDDFEQQRLQQKEQDEQVGLDCEGTRKEESSSERNEFLPMWIGGTSLVKRISFIGMPSSLGTSTSTSNISKILNEKQQQQEGQQQSQVSIEDGAAIVPNPPSSAEQKAFDYGSTRSSSCDLSNTSLETTNCVEAQNSMDDLSECCSYFTSNQEDAMIETPRIMLPPSSFVVKDLNTLPMPNDEILKQKAAALDRSNWDFYEPNYLKKGHEKNTASVILEKIVSKGIQVKEKAKGVEDRMDVPYFPVSECMWTFVGSFSILSLITFLSSCIALWNEEGKAFAFPLGPFGALTTLQCSLTDAAPAQPRNVLCGSTLCGFIALVSTYIPEEIVPLWLRISLATSTSISAMARLGIMHPPGGAIALVFSIGSHTFIHLVFTLMSCCLAVFVATVVNNLNDNRQYPRYWNIFAPLLQNRKH